MDTVSRLWGTLREAVRSRNLVAAMPPPDPDAADREDLSSHGGARVPTFQRTRFDAFSAEANLLRAYGAPHGPRVHRWPPLD